METRSDLSASEYGVAPFDPGNERSTPRSRSKALVSTQRYVPKVDGVSVELTRYARTTSEWRCEGSNRRPFES